MNREIRSKMAVAWRAARWIVLGALIAGAAGCRQEAADEAPPPSRWWYYEDAPNGPDMAFRTAFLMSSEGWDGTNSRAGSLSVFSDLYANGGVLIRIGITGDASPLRCAMKGCYLYVRRPDGPWQPLRAVPADESRQHLDLLNPWALQMLFEGTDLLEIEVPVHPVGTCIYSLPVADYRPDLHRPGGEASLEGDGAERLRRELTPADLEKIERPPSEWTTWPRCTGENA